MAFRRFTNWFAAWRREAGSLVEDFKKDPDGADDPTAAAPLDDAFLDQLTRAAPWIHHRRRVGNSGFREEMAPWVDRSETDEAKED